LDFPSFVQTLPQGRHFAGVGFTTVSELQKMNNSETVNGCLLRPAEPVASLTLPFRKS
jgi:hypothetical protein